MREISTKQPQQPINDRPTELMNSVPVVPPTLISTSTNLKVQQETNPEIGTYPIPALPEAYAKRFTRVHLLGKGGTGAAYAAYDTELERPVVLKVLYKTPAGYAPKDFAQQEARVVANLHHPGIVTLYDWIAVDTWAWLVLEYIPGRSLAEYAAKKGRLHPAEAISICVQVGRAVQYAHDQGVWHLDIKPGNVLLADTKPKVTDFGIAYRSSWGTAGPGWGTPGFAAAEQLAGKPTAQSDVYSLAALLWALLTGSVREGAATSRDWRQWKKVPAHLRPILRAALSIKPEARPSTPGAFSTLLEKAQEQPYNGSTLAIRWWDTILVGICSGCIMAVVTGGSPVAIASQYQGVWSSIALTALGTVRPAAAVMLAYLVLTGALMWRIPTLGVMMATVWPVLALLTKRVYRSVTLILLTPFLYAVGVSGLVPILAGALLPAVSAVWTTVFCTAIAHGISGMLALPLVHSYLETAQTSLPLPTIYRQVISVVLQISPRDMVFNLWPAFWQSMVAPVTLWFVLSSACIAVGVTWAKERFTWPTCGGILAALLVAEQSLSLVLGKEFSGLGFLATVVLSFAVCEFSPGRVEANASVITAWLKRKFPHRN